MNRKETENKPADKNGKLDSREAAKRIYGSAEGMSETEAANLKIQEEFYADNHRPEYSILPYISGNPNPILIKNPYEKK
ncbi:hypothetical protein CVD25_10695 [Bacillus canaveralius]|uniref:Uncharacterized protein n=1 Tax=Bacillus canaveralius TaxID=1403243 RepID=A0A2N5GM65_9BACI|nr:MULTISPECIES: hypothetical protein [Bacillus]PLR82903.1 hypothetical protein CU635_10500 [Bacillus canaveralius]PLR85273.1 hypothetical protein CVD23_10010 [Bacillus sp. V33-4]PLR97092.1 hypothetical protein CVD25_10695 [Bacillus canaveralius]RSK55508.1 hypothetical protein EJA13_03475 [Bacillus canaveralius]